MDFLAPLMLLTIWGIGGGLAVDRRSQVLMLTGCLLGTFFAVSVPGKFFPHYYQLYLPFLAVGAGWGIVTAAKTLQRWNVAPWIGGLSLAVLLCHVLPDCRISGKNWSRESMEIISLNSNAADRRSTSCLNRTNVFTSGESIPVSYYYSDRQPASGIFWADRLLFGPSKTWATQKVLADLEKTRPPLILIEEDDKLIPSLDHSL